MSYTKSRGSITFLTITILLTNIPATGSELSQNYWETLWVDSSSHLGYVFYVSWSPDGSKLATASSDKSIKIWEVSSGIVIATLSGHTECVRSVEWSPDGTKLASSADDGIIKIWNTSNWTLIKNLVGHVGGVFSVIWSPNGALLASCGCEDLHSTVPGDDTIRIWDVSTGMNIKILGGHKSGVYRISWSSDGSKIVSCSNDLTLIIWNAETGNAIKTLTGHTNDLRAVGFSPNGTWLASGGADCTVRIWDTLSGECVKIFVQQDHIRSVSWHPEGDKLAISGRNITLRILNVTTGEIIANFTEGGGVFTSSYSPDGTKVAICSAGAICSGGYNSVRVLGISIRRPEAPRLQLDWKHGVIIVSAIAFIACLLIFRIRIKYR
ncbi:MAG: WD40 repeat domain-containing protein [Candidatus Thermoplasmatota archaeon]